MIDIPKDWYTVETDSAKKERIHHVSYWKEVEKSWIEVVPNDAEENSIRIDSFWSRVFEMRDNEGRKRFPQLAALVKCILTLSHRNAGPEQGFSINKALIDAHGTSLSEDMIVALRRVKHRILQVGGILNFQITRPLLESVKCSRSRYVQELKAKEEVRSKRKRDSEDSSEFLKVESKIKNLETGIEVAEKAISDGSSRLERHLAKTPLDPVQLQADNALIQVGIERRKKLNDELAILTKKRCKLRKQTE